LTKKKYLSLDTETTGLNWAGKDEIVAIIISTDTDDYYFNFKDYGEEDAPVITRAEFYNEMEDVLLDPKIIWFMHNAKFDLHMLAKWGFLIAGPVHCTMAIERLLDSQAASLSLDNVAKRYGLRKSGDVMDYLRENKLYEVRSVEGKKKRERIYFWDKVPYRVLQPYGEIDGRITYKIGKKQRREITAISKEQGDIPNNIYKVYLNEVRLTRTVFHMEHLGVRLNVPYCEKAICFYESRYEALLEEWVNATGCAFVDSAKAIRAAVPDLRAGRTDKDQESFDKASLKLTNHPAASLILDIRECKKILDFFNTFLHYVDRDGYIHPSLNQSGTRTGRFSCSSPNLQQLTKDSDEALEDDEAFPIRRAIIPSEGHYFLLIDYDQQEYRMMLDYCGAKVLINKVKAGMDVHSAMAETVSEFSPISRKQAKTTNFFILYGGGIVALANKLGLSRAEARKIREAVFEAAPSLKRFIRRVSDRARTHMHVKNWLGRMVHFPPPRVGKKDMYYKAPNALIQGGCADVVKVAMNECDELLAPYKSRMVLCIHDELIFEIAYDEEFLVPRLKSIMEKVYPYIHLPLTATVEYSEHSLADRKELRGG